MSVLLPLRGNATRTRSTILDDEDADLARYRWFLNKRGYACRNLLSGEDGFPGMVLLHRIVLGLSKGDGIQVDHRNRNRLDNRRVNLRLADNALNRQNQPPRGASSAHRGVSFDRTRQRWMAAARAGDRHFRRRYRTEDEAAVAVADWRRENMPFSDEAAS